MGSRKGVGEKVTQAAIGAQDLLRLSEVPAGVSSALKEVPLISAGALDVAGDYYCDVDIAGFADAEIIVRASSVTGTVTPSAFSTYADGVTSKAAATDSGAGDLAAGVRRTFTLADLKGERLARFKFVVGGGESVTFDQAEVNGA